jgi:hypothetical protein
VDRTVHRTRPRRVALAALAVSLGLASALPAGASPETLKRSMSNILFGPFDVACAPIVGPRTVYKNIQDIEDSMWVRVVYVVPGVAWNTTLLAGSGIIRTMTGLIEFLPGLGLLFFKADLDVLFSPAEKSDALVEKDTRVLNIKFCIDYVE